MKKGIGWMLVLVLAVLCAGALADVEVNETTFPDRAFREFILDEYDRDGDHILSDEKLESVTNMYASDKEIYKLTGIEYFTSLTLLYCDNNHLTSLDLSHNTNLGALSCVRNPISELDVSPCPRLVNLVKNYDREGVSSNSLGAYSQWNAGAYGSLILNVPCTTTVLAGDFVSKPTVELTSTFFSSSTFRNILAAFDTNGDGVLSDQEIGKVKEIDCSNQTIYNLDGIEFLFALEKLDCSKNKLTGLDLRKNKKLQVVDCSGNVDLWVLYVDENNAALKELDCSENRLTKLDLSPLSALTWLNCSGNRLTALNVSQNSALKELDCGYNELTELDVSNNIALKALDCNDNALTALDVSNNTALKDLDCGRNALTALDVSNNTALKKLDCYRNKLTALDVSTNAGLTKLSCYTNSLQKLDVTNCTALKKLVQNGERVPFWDHDRWEEGSSDDPATWKYLHVDSEVVVTAGATVSDPNAPPPPAVGDTFTVTGLKYLLTAETTVSFTGLEKAKSLATVTVPATVTYANTTYKVTEIAAKALYKDTKVTTLSIGKNVKTIGKSAFASCSKLKTVKGGAAVTAIGDIAFSGCKVLKTFPALSRLKTIGANAFKGCVKITKFTLGAAVKKIGKNAFNGCKALKAVTVKTTKLTGSNVGAGAFKGIYKKATFTCPKSKLKAYAALFVKKGAPKTCIFK